MNTLRNIIHNFVKDEKDDLQKINLAINNYIAKYYELSNRCININKNYENQLNVKCPSCRKSLETTNNYPSVFVHTECICCLKSISKVVLFPCKHANICKRCWKKMKKKSKSPPFFIFENGDPVPITHSQIRLFIRKTKLFLPW